MSKKGFFIASIVGVVAMAAVGWSVMTGRLAWSSDGQVHGVAAVCGSNIVNKYNDAMYMVARSGSSEPSIDETGVKTIKTTIESTKGYENDATCQTLLFWISIHDSDYASAKTAYSTVKQLHDKGIFADNNIRGNSPLFMYNTVLNGISPNAKDNPDSAQ